MSSAPVTPLAAPPPFSRQRNRSRLVLTGLVLAIAGVVAVGTLITVPTHVRAPAIVADAAECAAAGATPGAAGCVLVRLDPSWAAPAWADRPGAAGPARLTTADTTVPVVLTRTAGPVLAAPLDAARGAGPATAVIDVGRRTLARLFLGQGLEADR